MSGAEVLISVTTFVNRYEAITARTDDNAKAAVALLHKRGITPDSVAGVKALLDKARTIQAATMPTLDPEREAQLEKAVGDMWAWYQEWAQVARTAIPNKRLRIHLGISTANPSKPEEPEAPAAV
jgi:chorismate mutase